MQKEWSSFRITLLLYILVLILPLNFYFVYASFKTIQNDTKIVHQTAWMGGTVEYLALNLKNQNTQQTMTHIDRTLQDISVWVMQNDNSKLYIGAMSLSQDFALVNNCWDEYKKIHPTQNTLPINASSLQCWEYADHLATNVQKMVYLKQNKMINLFYFSLTITMILTLFIVYMVRIYIHSQMKKHAIHDHETHLFNKKFFLAELHSTFTRSQRHEYPLSLLFVSLNNFTKETYDKKTKINIMKELGEIFTSVTRNSDIPCRYDENYFAVLLPLTDKEHALILESRLRGALEEHDFKVKPEINFSFATTQVDVNESEEAFIGRTKKALNL